MFGIGAFIVGTTAFFASVFAFDFPAHYATGTGIASAVAFAAMFHRLFIIKGLIP